MMIQQRNIQSQIVLLGVALLLSTAVPAFAQLGVHDGEWRHFGGDSGNTKYTSLDHINPRVASHSSQVAVCGDTIVVGDVVQDGVAVKEGAPDHVRGFDAKTDEFKWIFHTKTLEGSLARIAYGRLSLNLEPTNATVKFRDQDGLEYTREMAIEPDDYTIEVSNEGYETEVYQVAIEDHEAVTLDSKLQRDGPSAGDTRTIDGIEFVWCPPGSFLMGSPPDEKERQDDERQHRVTLSQGFWIGKYELTQEQWESVMGSNPSRFKGSRNPVESVSWEDCQAFIKKLNEDSGGSYRLPTESEWEYACRAGTTTAYGFGSSSANLSTYAWYDSNSGRKTHPVGGKKANAWGLHDMHGNVWEWCSDWFGDYPSGPVTDPKGPDSGSERVERGGTWYYYHGYARSANRSRDLPEPTFNHLGFRLVAPAGH